MTVIFQISVGYKIIINIHNAHLCEILLVTLLIIVVFFLLAFEAWNQDVMLVRQAFYYLNRAKPAIFAQVIFERGLTFYLGGPELPFSCLFSHCSWNDGVCHCAQLLVEKKSHECLLQSWPTAIFPIFISRVIRIYRCEPLAHGQLMLSWRSCKLIFFKSERLVIFLHYYLCTLSPF
jgi:hypothetical protein